MFKDILSQGAAQLGICLPQGAAEKMEEYCRALLNKNAELNLTAIRGEEEAATLHFLDSLGLLTAYDIDGKSVIDVGTGGGFPGVPLKIARPLSQVTVLDSTQKKVDFIDKACGELGIDVACLCGRAEELGLDKKYRERYQAAVSRAVARLDILSELCLPLVGVGGVFIALKSQDSLQEIEAAKRAIGQLGGKLAQVSEYALPGGIVRRAVIVEKVSPTPKGFPRRFARIKKAPL